jgi:amino acid transporter
MDNEPTTIAGSLPMSKSENQLQPDALGLLATAALTAAYMAPATSIYALFGPMVSQAGVAIGFVMLLGVLMTLPSAVSFGMLAKELPLAGGVYSWASRSLGHSVGTWVGLTTASYYVLTVFFPPIVFGQFFNQLLPVFHVTPNKWTWLIGAVTSLVVTGGVTYRGIVVSSRLAFTMLMTELAVVVALGLTFLVVAIAQSRFSWDPLLPTAASNGGSGITLALPLALLAMTCDAATPASEETRNARRTIPLAVVATCVLIGAWYVVGFSSFALAAPREELFSLVADPNINPIAPLARRVWGRFDLLVTITGMTASIGALIPCSTAASRVLFAMGRDGNLPGWLGTVDPRSRAPRNALHVVYLATILGVIPVALVVGETPAINWWSHIFGWYIAVVYFFANLSNLVYYRRCLRHQFHFFWNLLVPVIGIGAQLLVVWQLVVKEMWKDWFGRSGQIFIVAAMLMTVAYVYLSRGRRVPGDSPRLGGA